VVKSTESRWTDRAKYVYDNVQSLFGANAKGRFVLNCTFADGGQCLAADTMMPQLSCLCPEYFTFNNSAVYTPSAKGNPTTKMFWDLMQKSLHRFIAWVIKEGKPAMSLSQAQEVIEAREYLQVSVATAQKGITEGMQDLDALAKVLEDITKNEAKINASGCYTYKERVKKIRYKDAPGKTPHQFCRNCRVSCCQICAWPEGEPYSLCTYFRGSNPCPKCPGRCGRSSHERFAEPKIAEEYYVEETREDTHKKSELEKGQQGKTLAERLLNEKKTEMSAKAKAVLSSMQDVKNLLKRLEGIALKPKVFDDDQYFDQLIKVEDEWKKPGWQNRKKGLENMRDQARELKKIQNTDNLESLFPQYQKTIENAFKTGSKPATDSNSGCPVM